MENGVIIVGLVMGSMAIGSVCYVWIQKQVFGVGGGVLAVFGTLLIGLSVWSKASIELSGDSLSVAVEQLESQMEEVAEANLAVSEEVGKLSRVATASASQVDSLTATLVARNAVPSDALTAYRAEAAQTPQVDLERLTDATKRFRDIGATVKTNRGGG